MARREDIMSYGAASGLESTSVDDIIEIIDSFKKVAEREEAGIVANIENILTMTNQSLTSEQITNAQNALNNIGRASSYDSTTIAKDLAQDNLNNRKYEVDTYNAYIEQGSKVLDDENFLDSAPEWRNLEELRLKKLNTDGTYKYESVSQMLSEEYATMNSLSTNIQAGMQKNLRYNKNKSYDDDEVFEKISLYKNRLDKAVDLLLTDGVISVYEAQQIMGGATADQIKTEAEGRVEDLDIEIKSAEEKVALAKSLFSGELDSRGNKEVSLKLSLLYSQEGDNDMATKIMQGDITLEDLEIRKDEEHLNTLYKQYEFHKGISYGKVPTVEPFDSVDFGVNDEGLDDITNKVFTMWKSGDLTDDEYNKIQEKINKGEFSEGEIKVLEERHKDDFKRDKKIEDPTKIAEKTGEEKEAELLKIRKSLGLPPSQHIFLGGGSEGNPPAIFPVELLEKGEVYKPDEWIRIVKMDKGRPVIAEGKREYAYEWLRKKPILEKGLEKEQKRLKQIETREEIDKRVKNLNEEELVKIKKEFYSDVPEPDFDISIDWRGEVNIGAGKKGKEEAVIKVDSIYTNIKDMGIENIEKNIEQLYKNSEVKEKIISHRMKKHKKRLTQIQQMLKQIEKGGSTFSNIGDLKAKLVKKYNQIMKEVEGDTYRTFERKYVSTDLKEEEPLSESDKKADEFLSLWMDPDKGYRGSKASGQTQLTSVFTNEVVRAQELWKIEPKLKRIDVSAAYREFKGHPDYPANLNDIEREDLKGKFYSELIRKAGKAPEGSSGSYYINMVSEIIEDLLKKK